MASPHGKVVSLPGFMPYGSATGIRLRAGKPRAVANYEGKRVCERKIAKADLASLRELLPLAFNSNNPWGVTLSGLDPAVLLVEYGEGHQTRWHIDYRPHMGDFKKLTLVCALSDGYEGGQLLMHEGFDEPVPLGLGDAVIFPSVFMHRVTPVVSGTRAVLVAWCRGPAYV
jgi:hypothetical protein